MAQREARGPFAHHSRGVNHNQTLFEKTKLNRALPVFMWLHVGASPTEQCVGDREVRVHQQPSTNLGKNTSALFLKRLL